MAEFYTTISKPAIAEQIANMVNTYNKWYVKFSAKSIISIPAHYFIELVGGKIVCCAGIQEENSDFSKIMHICTLPEFRGTGLAKKVTKVAINSSKTKYVYMTIREDNTASIMLANALRFRYSHKHWFRDHNTLTFVRKRDENAD